MARTLLADIVTDAGTQVRVEPHEATVAEYAARMIEGDRFPAIVVFHDGNQYFLADGFHRVLAARRNDWRDIDADVRVGTKTDALWFALAANKANGRRLTLADKTHAVDLALRQWPEKTQREIADQVGCHQSLVSKVSASMNGNTGRTTARELRSQQRIAAVKELCDQGLSAQAVAEKVGLSRNRVSEIRIQLGYSDGGVDRSKSAVAKRRKDIAGMAAQGFATRQIAESLSIDPSTVTSIAKAEGIVIHADRVVAGTRRIDANRVVEQTVTDAENLTIGVDLINYDQLDRAQLGGWIESLLQSKKALSHFITRLQKEQSKHGQAA